MPRTRTYRDTPAGRMAGLRDEYLAALRAKGHQPTSRKVGRATRPRDHAYYLLTCTTCEGALQVGDNWTSTVAGEPRMSLYGQIWTCRGKRDT